MAGSSHSWRHVLRRLLGHAGATSAPGVLLSGHAPPPTSRSNSERLWDETAEVDRCRVPRALVPFVICAPSPAVRELLESCGFWQHLYCSPSIPFPIRKPLMRSRNCPGPAACGRIEHPRWHFNRATTILIYSTSEGDCPGFAVRLLIDRSRPCPGCQRHSITRCSVCLL